MNASRPITHSVPIRAPVRTWARCQIALPAPTLTPSSSSADAWTRAAGSIIDGSVAVVLRGGGPAGGRGTGRRPAARAAPARDPGPGQGVDAGFAGLAVVVVEVVGRGRG